MGEHLIKVDNLTKVYGKDFTAVDNISFYADKGEVIGFVGDNGAGKTTVIKCLTGILQATSGDITICGNKAGKGVEAKKCIGYTADNPDFMLRLTCREYLEFLADVYEIGKEERDQNIERLTKRFEIEEVLSSRLDSCSHGTRQKIMVTGALIHNPPVWILDEPMTGLDPQSAYRLKKMIREHADNGNCVFFSTHVLDTAEELCDKVIIIRKVRLYVLIQ
ncbi:MAG: ABC transporter ATP-binding protein [Acutalibacteraceae bacterium]|nr:ABC transporter ATP-binding protein [Acutalibacteraceae bacterium]